MRWTGRFGIAAAMLALTAPVMAQDARMTAMAAPAEPTAIPLGTGSVENQTAPEAWFRQYGVAMTRNVTTATLTPFLPDPAKATGAAVIVAPGGGFLMLSIENEGWRVAKALAERGIAAFVLKYRLKPTPPDMIGFEKAVTAMFAGAGRPQGRLKPADAIAGLGDQIADARAAVALVRARADGWKIDPARIGMIGFSAGAMTTMATALAAPDTRLAFVAPIYGSMEAVPVPAGAPPLFAVLAADDPLFANKGFGLVEAWQKAGRPVEFHLYQGGGHGFGLGKTGTTSTGWFEDFMHWLDANQLLVRR
ncbi:alpha/beta hydrolase fold domain-containing protein [Sphingomonas sp. DOAB1063]|uniref:Alpha/beta hydrolase fold domain-containing protein n=2 Tax=Sphingomonas albertensis TaxID=2762591 RepID=A0ABR7AIF6_9SPHN|nr:alpha/beta hydrolase fold domain-containing protein [Sphingomonas albertensis]